MNPFLRVEQRLLGMVIIGTVVTGFLFSSLSWAAPLWQVVWTGSVPVRPLHHYADDLGCLIIRLAHPPIFRARRPAPVNPWHCGHTQRNKQSNAWYVTSVNVGNLRLVPVWPSMTAFQYCIHDHQSCRKMDSCIAPGLPLNNSAGRGSGPALEKNLL